MKLPRDLNGRRLADHLVRRWNFIERKQTGSHIILACANPVFHVAVPNHKPLRIGTLQALLSTVAEKRGVRIEDVLRGL